MYTVYLRISISINLKISKLMIETFIIQVFCQHLTNASLTEKPLLLALYRAISVYTNYTGKASCMSIKSAESGLDDEGWDYQACTEMVMPMCSDGINDMFEPAEWNIVDYNNTCFKKYSVSPQPYLACEQYGCENLHTASNIVFRYENDMTASIYLNLLACIF